MPTFVFGETPIDPRRIERHLRKAGLAYEKHRWQFPTVADPLQLVSIFTFGSEPLREIYVFQWFDGEPINPTPLVDHLTVDAIPPGLNCTVAVERTATTPPAAIESLVANWPAPVSLVFSRAMIPPWDPAPRQTNELVEQITDAPWHGDDRPGFQPLPGSEMRRRAIRAVGIKNFHRLYLLAGPQSLADLPREARELFERGDGLLNSNEPVVDYRGFHRLVSACDWVLTSHGNVPGVTSVCMYSVQDLRHALRASSPNNEAIEEPGDSYAFNTSAGVHIDQRIGLKPSDVMPAEMLTQRAELSFDWSDIGQLDELRELRSLRKLSLDGTVIDGLAPLAEMPWLESLSIRCVQLDSIDPLTSITSLRELALSRVPHNGLAPVASIPSLHCLDLNRMRLSDLLQLGYCAHVEDLSVDNTRLGGLSGILQFPSLRSLSIVSTNVVALDPLVEMGSLDRLVANECHLQDLSPIPGIRSLAALSLCGLGGEPLDLPDLTPVASSQSLKHLSVSNTTFRELPRGTADKTLERLDMSASAATNITWLTRLTALREVAMARLKQVSMTAIEALPNLETLDASECNVGDLSWLEHLSRLRELRINLTEPEDLRPIERLRNLRSLGLAGVVLSNSARPSSGSPLGFLASLANLQELDLRSWQLGSPAWLTELSELRVLNVARSDFLYTRALRDAALLTELDVSDTRVTALDGLEHAHALERLRLDNTAVRSLQPIRDATNLLELRLHNTGVTDLAVLRGFKSLRKLDLRGGPVFDRDLSPLLALPRLELLLLDAHGASTDLIAALQRRHRLVLTPG